MKRPERGNSAALSACMIPLWQFGLATVCLCTLGLPKPWKVLWVVFPGEAKGWLFKAAKDSACIENLRGISIGLTACTTSLWRNGIGTDNTEHARVRGLLSWG